MANGSTGSPFFKSASFCKHLLADLAAADEQHVLQQRPLQHVENHDPAAGHLLPVGPHVDEQVGVVEAANVFVDQFQVEGPAGPGADVRQDFAQRQRLVAADLARPRPGRASKRRPATRSAPVRPGRRPGAATAKPLAPPPRKDPPRSPQRNDTRWQPTDSPCEDRTAAIVAAAADWPSVALSVLVRFAREERSEESRKHGPVQAIQRTSTPART